MSWYYEQGGQAIGPVTEDEFLAVHASGHIGPETRVWREGWPDWRPAREGLPEFAGVPAPQAPLYDGTPQALSFGNFPQAPSHGDAPQAAPSYSGATALCGECLQFLPDVVTVGGINVCLACKPLVLQKIREGVPVGAGAWRDGKQLVVLKGTPLPDACLKCAAPPVKHLKKTLTWHNPAFYILIFVGLLIYVIVALCVRKSATLMVPLCSDCLRKRRRNLAIGWLSFLGSVGVMILAGNMMSSNDSLGGTLMFGGIGLLLFSLFWAIGTQLVIAKKIDATHAWVAKVGRPFLDRLPPWPGS